MAEGLLVAISHPEQTLPVAGKETALDKPALPGQGLDPFGPQDIGVNQILAEIDATRPVLGSGERGRLHHGNSKPSAGQADRGRHAGTSRPDDDYVKIARNHLAFL